MKKRNLLTGNITSHMFRLALPSIGGMFAITIFNLTDTYFVSKLGTDALAAMGFTFPVVMIIGAFSGGISLGAGSILARAMGSGNTHKMHRIATDGILLSILSVFLISIIGTLTIDPVFRLLGAEGQSLELVKQYMSIWYYGAFVIVVPPVSDSSMRAMGDMIRPLLVMITCAIMNAILDPILIFGWFGLPAMGIRGASLATIISRTFGMVLTISFVHFHYGLLNFKYNGVKELLQSWSDILRIGIPNVIIRLLPQLLRAGMTRIAAGIAIGTTAVAAIAAGQRIESFATIISMAVGTALVPIIGQNFGAGKYDRVMSTRKLVIKISIAYGLLLLVLIMPFGEVLASIFSDDPKVIKLAGTYLRIILPGSIGLNQYNWLSESFNAVGKPRYSMLLNVVGTVGIMFPLLFVGSYIADFPGMVIGLTVGQLIVGLCAVYLSKKYLIG